MSCINYIKLNYPILFIKILQLLHINRKNKDKKN